MNTTFMPDCPGADFAVRMFDDSMNGARILKNDLVYIKRIDANEPIVNGSIVAVELWSRIIIRTFRKKGRIIQLRPENRRHLVIELDETDELNIIGRVVGFTSRIEPKDD